MASRALIARLTSADSSWFGSTSIVQRPAQPTVSISIFSPSERCRNSAAPLRNLLTSIGFGSSGCRREKASSRLVSAAARCAPRIALRRALQIEPAFRRLLGAWRCAVSRLPITIIRRLLKSWAMPPLSWPTASIFWDAGKLLLCLAAACVAPRALGDVARDLGKADQLAVFVADRVDDDRAPRTCVPSLRTRQPSASNLPSRPRSAQRLLRRRRRRGPPRCRSG